MHAELAITHLIPPPVVTSEDCTASQPPMIVSSWNAFVRYQAARPTGAFAVDRDPLIVQGQSDMRNNLVNLLT